MTNPLIPVGITGGIACGKSTILNYLREQGHKVFSADNTLKEIFPSEEVQEWLNREICERYGNDEHEEFFYVGKPYLWKHIINDPDFRKAYESFIHPLIRTEMFKSDYTYAEVPLLFESKIEHLFKEIWVITCNPQTQIERLINRLKCTEEYALSIINLQLPSSYKEERATRVINTDGIFEEIENLLTLDQK